MEKIIVAACMLLVTFFVSAESIDLGPDDIKNTHADPCTAPVIIVQPRPVNGGKCLNFLPQLIVDALNASSYQWYKNDTPIDGATQYVYSFNSSDDSTDVFRVDVINACATIISQTTRATGLPYVLPYMIINASQTAVGIGQSITFTTEQLTYGGSSPEYRWMVNYSYVEGATNDTFVLQSPVDNDRVYCAVKTNYPCAVPSEFLVGPITVTVYSSIGAGIISSDQTVCHTGLPDPIIEISPVTGETANTTYNWQVSPDGVDSWTDIPGATETDYAPQIPVIADAYYRRVVKDDSYPELKNMAVSNVVAITVTPLVTPHVSIAGFGNSIPLCTPINLSAHATNGGFEPSYRWMKNGVTIDWIQNYPVLIEDNYAAGDIFTCEMTSSLACVTISKVVSNPIEAIVQAYPSVSISLHTQTTLTDGQAIILKAVSEESPYFLEYTWYKNGQIIGDQTETLSTTYKSGDVYTVKMNVTYFCPKTYTVVSEPLILGSDFSTAITGPVSVFPNQTGVHYSVPQRVGMTYYWTVPDNADIVSGQGTHSIVVDFGVNANTFSANQRTAINNAITVKETNANAVSSTLALQVSIITATRDSKLEAALSVYPVPVQDECHIEFKEKLSSQASVTYTLYDSTGFLITTGVGTDKIKIDMSAVPSGIYLLLVEKDGSTASKKIVKQ
ncbi:T9SS type A sorting domain-containing protein [Cytophaga hutchinsonii]|uniref:Ig-like domain-containing protein n=1 Tax=Cytophaga hutchinsonii (strain ATCC 33406 / DSM 1761 / CIP 103989 / NBRC 15051 / NCIMB 9469 / D465) TaxID=269798 RepID=A0A6N4SV03_CYTH3|nr:T9SS type A sorting domain-containing protein [Cytophaga hutchinsonii]ABG60317.1 conserved hypothetical protein [Cytophaga hutchinsonii ATCC 33406]SFX99028.1 Por secretion system C-terminal sorting domain-containing protein [Cytophaga hutchinsonii ATCC 33406]